MMSSGSITGDDKLKKHTEWKTDFSVISVASLISDNRMDFQWNEMIKRSQKGKPLSLSPTITTGKFFFIVS